MPTPQNGQSHSNSSSAFCQQIVWVCLTILWGWRLNGKNFHAFFGSFFNIMYVRVKITELPSFALLVFSVSPCVKSVRIRNFSGPYSIQIWENTDQENSEYWYFLHSVYQKAFLNWLCQYLSFLNIFFNRFCPVDGKSFFQLIVSILTFLNVSFNRFCPVDGKSSSQLIVSIFIFSQYFFQKILPSEWKKFFSIDCINIYLFSMFFSIDSVRWKSVGLPTLLISLTGISHDVTLMIQHIFRYGKNFLLAFIISLWHINPCCITSF